MTQDEIFNKLDEIAASINFPNKSNEITSELFVLLKVSGTPPKGGGESADCTSAVKNKLREAMALLSFSPQIAINSMLEKKEQKND